jgi:hypothetical protein
MTSLDGSVLPYLVLSAKSANLLWLVWSVLFGDLHKVGTIVALGPRRQIYRSAVSS